MIFIILQAFFAIFWSCVIIITVFHSLFISLNKFKISSQVLESNAQVGSSAKMILGFTTKALAIATLWDCQPDNSFGLFFNLSHNHTFSSYSFANSWDFLFVNQAYSKGIITWFKAEIRGNKE